MTHCPNEFELVYGEIHPSINLASLSAFFFHGHEVYLQCLSILSRKGHKSFTAMHRDNEANIHSLTVLQELLTITNQPYACFCSVEENRNTQRKPKGTQILLEGLYIISDLGMPQNAPKAPMRSWRVGFSFLELLPPRPD